MVASATHVETGSATVVYVAPGPTMCRSPYRQTRGPVLRHELCRRRHGRALSAIAAFARGRHRARRRATPRPRRAIAHSRSGTSSVREHLEFALSNGFCGEVEGFANVGRVEVGVRC